jgi:MscS family membrane protein
VNKLYQAALEKAPPKGGEQTLLERYLAYSGPLISTRLTDAIPSPLHRQLFGQPVWKYIASTLIVLLILGVSLLLYDFARFLANRCDPRNEVRRDLVRLIPPLFLLVAIPVALQVIALDVRLRLLALDFVDDVLWIWFYVVLTWVALSTANLMAAIIIRSPSISPEGLDASMVRLACRLVAYIVAIWVWVEGLQALGLSLVPLLAGVGVSGLAFALAAKPTLGNLLGGVILFADKPFRVGHRVVVGDHQGTIEEIGLRSTRLRTLDGHLVSLPNDEVCASGIENVAARPNIKRLLNLTLTYDTPPQKVERAIEIVRQLLSLEEDGGLSEEELGRPSNWHLHTDDENLPPRVYFSDLNADSLNIMVIYWFAPPDYWAYLEHATWLNLQIIERFNAEEIEFAFPTQTIDLKPRDGAQADSALVAAPDR